MPTKPTSESRPLTGDPAKGDGIPATIGRLESLVSEFFDDTAAFGEFCEIPAEQVPEPSRRLLHHRSHMTVTMEDFVGETLGLRVLRELRSARGVWEASGEAFYAREIQLVTRLGRPVQYGIVRIDLGAVPPQARRLIESKGLPLGRILIEAGTLRHVHDVALTRIAAGKELARRLDTECGRLLYGRVATISVAPSAAASDPAVPPQPPQAARPAVELLEIPLVG